MTRRDTALAALALSALAATVLAGCAPETADDPRPEASQTAAPEEAPEEPALTEFDPEGTAEDNLELFAQVTNDVWESEDGVRGRDYVDALVAKGFDKSQMQVTSDATTIGWEVESLMFSVQLGDECLVGQVGPSTGDPVANVQPLLDAGTCMLGSTRAIDW